MQCFYNISKKKLEKKFIFLHADKHQSFQEVNFNTLCIKRSYKGILSLLIYMIKHSQSTQSNNFAISLQYFKIEVKDEVHFLHTNKQQSFYKLVLSLLMEEARHVQIVYPKLK